VIAHSSTGSPVPRPRLTTRAPLALAALAVALLAVLAYRVIAEGSGDAIHEAVSEGRVAPAPDFELDVLTAGDLAATPRRWWRIAHDRRVSLAELRGHPAVINFWTGRCTPCREEAPLLERATREAGHGVLILGISSRQPAQEARALVQTLGLSFPQLHDGAGETARRWGVDGVPETFFVSRDGKIVGHVVGASTTAQLQSGVAAAVAGRPAGLRTGGRRRDIE
jgi:cytochrome c biogenesis protein CcmG/thiol:disulfide interchange protein DsbE